MYERMKPVFADVDQHLCLDPEDVVRKITKKTKAIIFYFLFCFLIKKKTKNANPVISANKRPGSKISKSADKYNTNIDKKGVKTKFNPTMTYILKN